MFALPGFSDLIGATTPETAWAPGIGDPTFVGWFTVFAYLATAIFCWQLSRVQKIRTSAHTIPSNSDRRLWFCLAVVLFALGINKQLDLQTALTQWGRWVALEQGWYEDRRLFQKAFVFFVAMMGMLGIVVLKRSSARAWRHNRLAILGLVFLVSFVVIRAASFHHVDVFLSSHLFGARFNVILELSGIGCIAIGSLWRLRARRASRLMRRSANLPVYEQVHFFDRG